MKKIYLVLYISLIFLASPALADDHNSEKPASVQHCVYMSEEQILLHNYATEAVKSGDYEKAQRLLKASSMLGENNILWYEQGKVYAKLNRCQEAYDAYHHVANAPVLYYESHPPETILKETQKELVDLDEQCNAKVIFNCKPDNITLSIEGGYKFECTDEPVKLAPGRYEVAATWITDTGYTIRDNATIKLSANQTERIDVFLEVGDCYPANPPFFKEHFTFWGWVMAGTGLALTTVGTGLFFADPIGGDELNNVLTSTALITLGGANFIAGLAVLIANPPNPSIKNNSPEYGFCNNICGCGLYEDWSEVKKEYRAWGWGLFGSGLALTAVGTGIWFADDIDGSKDINKIIFTPLVSLGSLAVVTGVIILIYNNYKFGMNSQYGMQFQPEIMLSPQMTGFGVSGRF